MGLFRAYQLEIEELTTLIANAIREKMLTESLKQKETVNLSLSK